MMAAIEHSAEAFVADGSAIALHARPSAEYARREAEARALLRAAHAEFGDALVQSSSLGVEDMVLTDLLVAEGLPVAIATLDTGRLHAQTLALLDAAQRHYGRDVEVWAPDAAAVAEFAAREGDEPMYRSVELRHACCALRKLEPLARMMQGRRAWIVGLRRQQSAQRAGAGARELDAQGRVKFSPLLDWTAGDVWHYVAQHRVPYNALHDHHYPSIGCAPCTRAVALGEDERAGRWWWEQDGAKECGLHAVQPLRRIDQPGETT
jgi:phosphoadenosine phosphosulfate reductase